MRAQNLETYVKNPTREGDEWGTHLLLLKARFGHWTGGVTFLVRLFLRVVFFRHEWGSCNGGRQSQASQKLGKPRCETDTWGTRCASLSTPSSIRYRCDYFLVGLRSK
jgi:hypothetical protein